ncbi:MAG: hypothetical protein WDN26_05300 [Chitinophagaceae bacterium]
MVAEFYIIAESFEQNPNLTVAEIEAKTKSLANDFVYIRKYKDSNKLFIHPDIYDVNFVNNVSISDLLYNDEIANNNLDRDVRVLLKRIIWESETSTNTTQDVIDVLLPEHNENLCHGLIGFNILANVSPEFQVVYHLNGWLDFRRHYLKLYPKNQIFFIDECIKYFPNLFFHERNKTTVGAILHNCPKKIVYHLAALNDEFRNSQQAGLNRTQALEQFSISAALDETASLEGNAARKPALTFKFTNNKNEIEDICCEPHLKLCRNDFYPGDNSYSNDRRIYFHEGKSTVQEGKILIGHIGDHL